MGEGRCAIRQRVVPPEVLGVEREGLRRVREPDFDPDEGAEWPADPERDDETSNDA